MVKINFLQYDLKSVFQMTGMGTEANVKMLSHWIFFLSFLSLSDSRIGFVKDQSEDKVEFPPKSYKKFNSPIPVGHLRPLGKLYLIVTFFTINELYRTVNFLYNYSDYIYCSVCIMGNCICNTDSSKLR